METIAELKDATRQFQSMREINKNNDGKLRGPGMCVFQRSTEPNKDAAKKPTADTAFSLERLYNWRVGTKVMLTNKLRPKMGLVNGMRGGGCL